MNLLTSNRARAAHISARLTRVFETLGYLTLRAFEALFPTKQPPRPPDPPRPEPGPPPGFLIGKTAANQPIYALAPQLDRHLLIIGGTGCGKTTLIARLFTEEILKWQ